MSDCNQQYCSIKICIQGLLPMIRINIRTGMVVLLVSCLLAGVGCQIARDIALKYMYLDTNGDNLVSSAQLLGIKDTDSGDDQLQYFYWRKYQTYKYPQWLLHKYDTNGDTRLSFLQFHQLVLTKIKKHQQKWSKSSYNLLNHMKTQDYFLICDADEDDYIGENQMLACVQAFIIYQFRNYPHRVRSLLYPNRTIGYDYQEWRMLFPKTDQFEGNRQIQQLFYSFQWPESKIKEDTDLLIGPQQGRFMQPTMLYFYLDTNWDEVLDRDQALKYLNKYGGNQAFEFADFTGDGKLDQAQLIAYFLFAMCIDDCDPPTQEEQKQCSISSDEELMFSRKYQTEQAICNILEGLMQQTESQTQQKKVQQQIARQQL